MTMNIDSVAYSNFSNEFDINVDIGNFANATIKNLTTQNISAIDSVNINVLSNIIIPSTSFFYGNLHGNSDTSTNFTGPLTGDIVGGVDFTGTQGTLLEWLVRDGEEYIIIVNIILNK